MSLYEMEQWKRFPIPAGFEMVKDTREQDAGLFCNPPDDLVIVRKCLKHGDYSIAGYEDSITIERKWSDFWAYVGSERQEKTIPKLEAMSEYLWAALVVEGDPFRIPSHAVEPKKKDGKRLTKMSIWDFFKSCSIHYGIHVFWGNRYMVECYVLVHLTYCYKHFGKLRKEAG